MKLHSCYIHQGVQNSDKKMFILGIFKREFSQIQTMENGTYANTAVSPCSSPLGPFRPEQYADQPHNFMNLNFCDLALFFSLDHFQCIKTHSWLRGLGE